MRQAGGHDCHFDKLEYRFYENSKNLVVSNSGQYNIVCNIGGNYDFKHCTFVNAYPFNRDKQSIYLSDYYTDLNENNFSTDPYIIWYDLSLNFVKGNPTTAENAAQPCNVAVFDCNHNKVLRNIQDKPSEANWEQKDSSGSWEPLQINNTNGLLDFSTLKLNNPLSLVIINPLYYKTLSISDDFMKKMYPHITNII